MKKYKVTIPYRTSKISKERYIVDFSVIAEDKIKAKELGLKKFSKFLEYNLASWVRIPDDDEITVEFIEEIKEPEPWSYL